MGEVNLHIYNKELLLQEQSDRFNGKMVLGENSYYYLLYGKDHKNLLAYALAEPKNESQLKFGSGFVAENFSFDKLSKLQNLQLEFYLAKRDFSLVPVKLFDETKTDLYLDHPNEGKALSRKFSFGKENFYIVWQMPSRINEILRDKYEHHTSYHVAELMLRKAKQLVNDYSSFVHFLYIGQSLFVSIVKNGQLQAVNAYEIKTKEDLLYFCVLSFENHGLQPQVDTIFLSGVFREENNEISLLKEYFAPRVVLLKFSPIDASEKAIDQNCNSLFALIQA